MISIITVVNKKNIYRDWLEESLLKQKMTEYQIIVVDNCYNQHSTLVAAYNSGVLQANGELLMFIHPDVRFDNEMTLSDFYKKIVSTSELCNKIGIWGVAGVQAGKDGKKVSTIYHGEDKKKVVNGSENEFNYKGFIKCQTVDACCFVIKKDVFEKFGFCKQLNGFHMVIEELCIRMEKENYDVVVLPIQLWHRSKGASLDYSYYRELRKVLNMYKDLCYLNTTSFKCNNTILFRLKLVYYQYRNRLHHYFLRLLKFNK